MYVCRSFYVHESERTTCEQPVYQKRFVNTAETQIINAAAVTFLKWLSFKEIADEFEFSFIKLKRGEEEVFVSFKILTHL